MASIKLTGDTSGEITISAPAVAGTNTLTLPASTGEILTTSNQSTNTPYFVARIGTAQSVTDNVWTKASFDTIISESTSSGFDTTNKKFVVPSGKGGIYQIQSHLNVQANTNSSQAQVYIRLYLNGSAGVPFIVHDYTANYIKKVTPSFSRIISLSAGDEIEIYGFCNVTSGTVEFSNQSLFSMFKLIT